MKLLIKRLPKMTVEILSNFEWSPQGQVVHFWKEIKRKLQLENEIAVALLYLDSLDRQWKIPNLGVNIKVKL